MHKRFVSIWNDYWLHIRLIKAQHKRSVAIRGIAFKGLIYLKCAAMSSFYSGKHNLHQPRYGRRMHEAHPPRLKPIRLSLKLILLQIDSVPSWVHIACSLHAWSETARNKDIHSITNDGMWYRPTYKMVSIRRFYGGLKLFIPLNEIFLFTNVLFFLAGAIISGISFVLLLVWALEYHPGFWSGPGIIAIKV